MLIMLKEILLLGSNCIFQFEKKDNWGNEMLTLYVNVEKKIMQPLKILKISNKTR